MNVIGDHTAAAFIARSEGLWSADSMPAEDGDGPGEVDESPSWPNPED